MSMVAWPGLEWGIDWTLDYLDDVDQDIESDDDMSIGEDVRILSSEDIKDYLVSKNKHHYRIISESERVC